MTVHWTRIALEHLAAIRAYIASSSPRYAQRFVNRIVRHSERLARFPLIGAAVPEYDDETIREVLEYPHRIIYKVLADRIDILAVIHGAQNLPRTPPE